MPGDVLKKPTEKELSELSKLMEDPKKRLVILKEFNRLMEQFFVWKEKEDAKQVVEKQEKSLIGKLLEKISKMQ